MAQIAAGTVPARETIAWANPVPLGMGAFALPTFVLGCINAGLLTPIGIGLEVLAALAFFFGGLIQLLAGMWEFRLGNTLHATIFSSYAGFWLAFGFAYLPGGIVDALTKTNALHPALGIFYLGWTIFTALMLISSFRTNWVLVAFFTLLFLTFLCLTIMEFSGSGAFRVLSGILGILTALVAWYDTLAGLLNSIASPFTLPVGVRD
jgi:hypothetical protein